MKAFQAYGSDGCKVTRTTAKEAAVAFFEQNPGKRKCNVIEGELDGHFFTVKYGRASAGEWPKSWKDVTKKSVNDLPGSLPVIDEIESDKLSTLGMATITSCGQENIYMTKDDKSYFSKVFNTEDYAVGEWDFSTYPNGKRLQS